MVAMPFLPVLALGAGDAYLRVVIPSAPSHLSQMPVVVALVSGLLAAISLLLWRSRGPDSVTADDYGLRVSSRRHGDRDLAWADLEQLGWLRLMGKRGDTGLVGRLVRDPGQATTGRLMWLCNPAGRLHPRECRALQALAESHGVAWTTDYPSDGVDADLVDDSFVRRL
ncbi:hypothetical protein acdb102_39090 [Acidothermaceae bacterium B102]|nr:hypothetical protein acdb102_39090 [Acidothermaceae bacterium B102]